MQDVEQQNEEQNLSILGKNEEETPPPEPLQETEPNALPQTMEGLSSLFANNMPTVEPYVSDKMAPRPNPKNGHPVPPGFEGKTDKYGRTFNPEWHEVDSSGNPVLTRDGNLRRKPGRQRLVEVQIKSPEEAEAEQVAIAAQVKQQASAESCLAVSAMAISTLEALTVGMFGDEWQLGKHEQLGIDEKSHLIQTTSAYLQTRPDMDIPPGALLLITFGMVYAPRFAKPKTQTKMEQIKNWLLSKWLAFKSRPGRTPKSEPTQEAA